MNKIIVMISIIAWICSFVACMVFCLSDNLPVWGRATLGAVGITGSTVSMGI